MLQDLVPIVRSGSFGTAVSRVHIRGHAVGPCQLESNLNDYLFSFISGQGFQTREKSEIQWKLLVDGDTLGMQLSLLMSALNSYHDSKLRKAWVSDDGRSLAMVRFLRCLAKMFP